MDYQANYEENKKIPVISPPIRSWEEHHSRLDPLRTSIPSMDLKRVFQDENSTVSTSKDVNPNINPFIECACGHPKKHPKVIMNPHKKLKSATKNSSTIAIENPHQNRHKKSNSKCNSKCSSTRANAMNGNSNSSDMNAINGRALGMNMKWVLKGKIDDGDSKPHEQDLQKKLQFDKNGMVVLKRDF